MTKTKLIAVHNLSIGNLLHCEHLGGLACPSLAVVSNAIGMNNFGEITLVADPKLINPRKVKVFNADIYSSRYPACFSKIDSKLFTEALNNVAQLIPEFGIEELRLSGFEEKLHDGGIKDVYYSALYNPAMMLAFARLNNRNPRISYIPAPVSEPLSRDKKVFAWMKKNKVTREELTEKQQHELGEIIREYTEDYIQRYNADFMRLHPNANPEITARRLLKMEDLLAAKLNQTEYGYIPSLRTRLNLVNDYITVTSINKTIINTNKLTDTLMKFVKSKENEFYTWIENLFQPTIKEQYFSEYRNNGDRRNIPYTLDNIVKNLNKTVRDGEGFCYGSGNIRALLAHQFKSYSDMEDHMSTIVTDTDFEKIKDELNNRLIDLSTHFEETAHYKVKAFDVAERFIESLKEYITRGERTWTDIYAPLTPENRSLLQQYIHDLKNAPTTYFEAKFNRAVTIDEFSAAIVPSDTPKSVISMLESKGLPVTTYQKNNNVDRLLALNKYEQFMFGEGAEFTLPTKTNDRSDPELSM